MEKLRIGMVGAGNIDRLVEPVKEILCKQIRKP